MECPTGPWTIFVNRSPRPSRQPDSHSHSQDCGGMPRVIGHEPSRLLSEMRAWRVRGCTPTSIAKKAIRITRSTGIAGLASPCAESHWMRNSSASSEQERHRTRICSVPVGKTENKRSVPSHYPGTIPTLARLNTFQSRTFISDQSTRLVNLHQLRQKVPKNGRLIALEPGQLYLGPSERAGEEVEGGIASRHSVRAPGLA